MGMLVSVIMPTYNCEKYIVQSVQSVIEQTLTDWEILIVDDGSTDHTEEVLKPYLEKYPTIRYTRLSGNRGPAVARTEAIKQARGKYIAFLDSDDVWFSEKLEKQVAFMEAEGALFCCTAYEQMNESGTDLGVICVPPKRTDYKKMLRLSNPIGNLTVMYNQEKLGKYEVPNIKKRNDFALWLRILHDTPECVGIPEVLGMYRIRENSVSSNKLKQAKFHWQLYRKVERLGWLQSVWAMLCWAWVKGTGIGLDRRKK